MRKSIVSAVIASLLVGVLAVGCGNNQSSTVDKKGEAAKFVFKYADIQPPTYSTVVGARKFAELVEQRTNGRIKIDVYDSAQLGEEKAVLEQLQLGVVDFARINASPLGEYNKQFGLFVLPYLFDNEAHMWKFLESDTAKKMLDNLQKSKMQGLAFYDGGTRSFYARKPINSIDDLKGMKIRTQESRTTMEMVKAVGASPTPMPYGQVFSALQTGVVDGAENNLPSWDTSSHYQVAKYMIQDEHLRIPDVMIASKSTWDKLSEEDRKIIREAAWESVKTQREAEQKNTQASLEKLKKAGVTITPVQDLTPWRNAVKPVIDKAKADFQQEFEVIEKLRK